MLTEKKSDPKADQIIDLGHSRISKRADGIIEIDCSDNFEYEVVHIKQNLDQIKKISAGKKVLVLSCSQPFTTTTKEVRDYVASAPHRDFIKAEAFVIHTLGQKMLGNFYLKINKPIVPAMFFKSKSEAEKWLKSFK